MGQSRSLGTDVDGHFFHYNINQRLHPNSKLRGDAITKVTEFVTEAVKKVN
jgi:hypothetical protein